MKSASSAVRPAPAVPAAEMPAEKRDAANPRVSGRFASTHDVIGERLGEVAA
jgi:hypothetical protein